MPMMVGGAVALTHSMGTQRSTFGSQFDLQNDPELIDYQIYQDFVKKNLKCTIKFLKNVIPPEKGKLEGIMVLEAKKDIEHSGLFILMKGLPVDQKKRKQVACRSVKFTVLGSTLKRAGDEGGDKEFMTIDGRSRETYPLELDIPEELPPPLISGDGKLIYRMQVFISTVGGRHVSVGEVGVRWQGFKVLTREEIYRELKIEQQVLSKRALLGLGRRRTCELEWRIEKGGCLPGELIRVELMGEGKEKMEVEFKVELVQKVWYQVPSASGQGKMWVKMKINVLVWEGRVGMVEGGEEKGRLWVGEIKVPRGITPTWKFDFTNSVSYTIRVSCGVAGESRESWVTGEVPVLVGSSKEEGAEEIDENKLDGGGGDDQNEENEEEEVNVDRSPSPVPQEVLMRGMRRGSGGSAISRRSQSMFFIPSWARPRAGSVSSVESCQSLASSTLSMFRMPPSYSQLSSRRPTLETLPPAYNELDLEKESRSRSVSEEQDEMEDSKVVRSASAVDFTGGGGEEVAGKGEVDKEEVAEEKVNVVDVDGDKQSEGN